jgi:hypothetical protein
MMARWITVTAVLLACAMPASARMYQWLDPQSRTTQLSGKPPAWYRLDSAGPRVFVFDEGRLVDDTARPLAADAARALRQEAFARARIERDPATSLDARLEAALRQRGPARAGPAAATADEDETANRAAATDTAVEGNSTPETEPAADPQVHVMTRLRAMLDAWDRQQTDRARQILDSAR